MADVPLTRDELEERLWDQLDLNEASAKSYDDGMLVEARRIAVGLRVLFHDKKPNSLSLLGQLEVKDKLEFVNTANPVDPENLLTTAGLTVMKVKPSEPDAQWVAPLGDGPPSRYSQPPMSFDDWWGVSVIKDNQGEEFSRGDLVLAIANKEGAHTDPTMEESMHRLSKSNSLGWIVVSSDTQQPMASNPVYPSIRQIQYEVSETLSNQLAKFGISRP